MNQMFQMFTPGMLNYSQLNRLNTNFLQFQQIPNIFINNNNENKQQQIQNENNLMFQILQNPNMTNEDRLNMLLKNKKGITLHPIIMKVLKDREKFRELHNQNNLSNNFSNYNENNFITNSQDKNNLLKKKSNNHLINNQNYSQQSNQNINHNILKFPIDDTILFSDLEKYNLSKDIIERPKGEKINIEYEIFNKVIIIWDFIITFNENLINGNLLKYNINENILEFYNKVIDENDDEYYKQLLTLFLLLVARNIKILENNSIEQDIFIIKSFLENPYSTPFNCFYDCLIEILKIISNCSIYRNLFDEKGLKIINIIIEKDKFEISKNDKIILLNSLIALAYETIIIKGKIREELEKMSSMSIEKMNLEENLKENEKRKKEINKNDYLEKVKEKIESLEKQLNAINEKEDDINLNPDLKKQKSEIENQINSNQSLIKENESLNERKKDYLEKIQNIKDKIISLKVPRKKLLGSDYLKSDYFYFNTCPGKLFIKNKKEKFWAVIKDKKLFQELTDKLTEKGIREKKLKYYLSRIIHELDNLEIKKKEEDEIKNSEIIENENKDNNKDDNNNNENNNNENNNEKNNNNENNNNEKNENEKNENDNENDNEKVIEDINDITESINDDSIENENIENKREKEKENENENENENDNKNSEDEIIDINKEIIENIIPKKYTINEILLGMEEKFSEYLSQFDKEWESEINRIKWKEIIQTTNIENNYIQTLKMFNHRFKNPYKILSEEEEKELKNGDYTILNNVVKYNFIDKNGNIFNIYETDPSKILSPKVKIWSKEIELYEIDKYYSNILLNNVKTHQQLWFILHFYENIIFGLIKRRENKKKFI
jgi:flagellar biosynthesis GTPase FlhF